MSKPNPPSRLPALPDTLPPESSPDNPFVIQRATLGQAVQLGELYDVRSVSFLGAQMYDQVSIANATARTYNKFGDLSLIMSNSLQDKAATIDLGAELSVSVLGGLIKVSGSAAFFHDVKSNTQERSWVLSYRARFMEERLCFSEKALADNILPFIQTNYLSNGAATHFVSAITYGGNVFVRMTAQESKLDEQDKIEGKLSASFEDLKAALDVSGQVQANIESQLSELNDKFDIQVYGDVALPSVPLNPEDVKQTFANAAAALLETHHHRQGVPMYVTLQPIPASLFENAQVIHRVNQDTLNYYMDVYAKLNDIRCRFNVLEEFAKTFKDIIPDFAVNQVQQAVDAFRDEYRVCQENLGETLKKILKGEEVDSESLLTKARKLYERHILKPDASDSDDSIADIRKPLSELEPFFFKFRDFVTGIRLNGFRLKSVNELSLAARTRSNIPLILMPPIEVDDLSLTGKLIQLSFLLRIKVPLLFNGAPDSCYLLYIEDVRNDDGEIRMEDWLPNDDAVFKGPTVYSGIVSDTDGTLNWTMFWPTYMGPEVASAPASTSNSSPGSPKGGFLHSTLPSPNLRYHSGLPNV